MVARFEAVGSPNMGFDKTVSPPWLMAPRGWPKAVGLARGKGMTVVSSDPRIAVALDPHGPSQATRQIIVLGVNRGKTTIEARSGGRVHASLEVEVKSLKEVKTAFHFVSDSATPAHKTRRTHAEVDPLLKAMNDIYLPQTNIWFAKHLVRDVTVPVDLGRTVVERDGHAKDEWDDVVALGDATADFNVFFVWRVEMHGAAGDQDAIADVGGPNCLLEDRAGRQVGETLAHEAGHFLGVDGDLTGHRNWLMHAYTDRRGRHIPKRHANIMNP